MYVYTFEYGSQWTDGFYQVMANSETEARNMLKESGDCTIGIEYLKLVSEFYLYNEWIKDSPSKIIYAREIENPNYEG